MARLPALADIANITSVRLPEEPDRPPLPPGRPVVFLLDASTGLEDRLLRSWIDCLELSPPPDVVALSSSRIRRPTRRTDVRLEAVVHDPTDPWLIPLRVVWMPAERHGRRTVSWIDVAKLGDPRDPRWWRDYLILARRPDRVRIVVGAGATASDLLTDHATGVEYTELLDFVTRRAWRSLDRAERTFRGDRYKISRFVAEDILNRPRFRNEVIRLGRERGLPEPVALARARYYVAEISASHSPFVIDLIANLIHWVYRQGYGSIRYDPDAIAEIARLGRDHPVAFLPSHRSNLDRLVLQYMLWENDLPPNHTAGGINMNFFPVGPLIRRTGVFFIRRSFKDNELYKLVVRTYLEYLIEKRFPLEWYMEGGRSRSGRLRPPRFGMMSWVVDAVERGKADDLFLLPLSISYDHIQDVASYAAEATGRAKERESFSWALRSIASLRRRYGDIHVSFAEPISVRKELDGGDPLKVQKLAFEVMHRIGSVTPITPTALASIVVLANNGRAVDLEAVQIAYRALAAYVARTGLPCTTDLQADLTATVSQVMTSMVDHGLASSDIASGRRLFWAEGEEAMRASYYRNMVLHFFVPRALAELSLPAPSLEDFWTDLADLRDLLKFEFFFADKEEFRRRVDAELSAEADDWRSRVAAGEGSGIELQPSVAGWAVRPLLETYLVMADELASRDGEFEPDSFVAACAERGQLYLREGRIVAPESVTEGAFDAPLRLADNRGLLDPAAGADRQAFASRMVDYASRLH